MTDCSLGAAGLNVQAQGRNRNLRVSVCTASGFRALARISIREQLDYPPDVIEAQLAHKPSGALGAAYNRSQFLKQRKVMMQDWADLVMSISPLSQESDSH